MEFQKHFENEIISHIRCISPEISALRMIALVSIFVIVIFSSVYGLFPAITELSFHSIVDEEQQRL